MSVRHYDWLAHHARRAPANLAVVDLRSERRLSYREFDQRTAGLAAFLATAHTVTKGDRVAVLAHNSTDVLEIQFACAKIGAIFVPLNWRLTVPELKFIVGDADPMVLIHDRDFAEPADELKRLCAIRHLIETDGGGGDTAYERAIAETGAGSGSAPAPVALTHDDISTIMYTSGTTGLPKGAIITYGMTFYNTVNLGLPMAVSATTVALTVLPLFHTAGLNCFANVALHAGGTVLVMDSFEPGAALALIDDPEIGVTHFFGVPAHYLFMSQHPDFASTDFARLQTAGIGGAPTPIALLETYSGRGMSLQQGYGMTETSPVVLVQDRQMALDKPGSAGMPALHTEVRVVDEAGRDVPQGSLGELWAKGPNITPGYWNRPDATRESITDGWLHTGDVARVDADGAYYIVDRWKDMYISGGENVYPAEVEGAIFELPAVAEVAVIGVPDPRWDEVGCAVVVLKPDEALDADGIIAHCQGRLARFKIPKSVVFLDELPHNATGKVLKRVLREQIVQ